MAQRRHHYERAFEAYLRSTRTPYISVDEAKRSLLPPSPDLSVTPGLGSASETESLKSFDFVIYSGSSRGRDAALPHLLVEVKGRQVGRGGERVLTTRGRLENWATSDDITALTRWQSLFNGPSGREEDRFEAAFVFVYWCTIQPPDALFQDVFEFRSRWYALRMISVDAYAAHMRVRSPKWGTVHLSRDDFERLSTPLSTGTGRAAGPRTGVSTAPTLQRALAAARRDRAALRDEQRASPAAQPGPAR